LTFLSEAYLLNGQLEKARHLAMQGLEGIRVAQYRLGIGWAQRSLGRIAQAKGALSEAETHLNEALETFASIHARYFVGRTHLDLAALAHAQGKREAAATHLQEAHSLFTDLRVPRYIERTEGLAKEFGVPGATRARTPEAR
jgi:tetratricopeptide (TPR) repeat protein